MSEILFGVSDAAGIRFCVSPLWETVRSRYVLADTEGSPVHLPWRREARELTVAPAAAHGVALLAELTRPRAYFPDFLTPAPADAALAALFGASRARMLDMLRQPATTSELSRRLGMSAGAVSEHLQVLHAAGLLARSRHGRTVLYVATAAGHTLLDAGAA
ncbi:winged helix-turn-helix domain-containing protein [Catellatospora sp. NPDC049133]|uniref:ArsR/SmtB family transcription factor n=1 Tax=Catellatospora sp. NPDC049133 TaxID=3155499 RepID=UPI0033F39D52